MKFFTWLKKKVISALLFLKSHSRVPSALVTLILMMMLTGVFLVAVGQRDIPIAVGPLPLHVKRV